MAVHCAHKLRRVKEAINVFGSDDDTHPGIKHLFKNTKEFYVGGKLQAVQRLEHYDFLELRCESKPSLESRAGTVCQDGEN